MLTRKLGRSGIEVSAVGMGCWAIGGPFWSGETPVGWGQIDDAESIRAIHAAIDLGVNFFDTADAYGAGHSETILGQALKDRRDQVVIATKFGNLFDPATKQMTGGSADPDYVRQACEDSLRRLDTDVIDLYQFHINDHPVDEATPLLDVLEELVAAGKIRAYGWSTDFIDGATMFAQGEHCSAIQFDMNVIYDAPQMVAFCESNGQAGINRGPLAMGLLTGKYGPGSRLADDDVRGKDSPEWLRYFEDGKPSAEWLAKVDAVREILTSEGRTLVQGALAWFWGRSEVLIPIPGFKTVAQVQENSRALEFGPLTAAQVAEIDGILER